MSYQFSHVRNSGGRDTVAALSPDGRLFSAEESHPHFQSILTGLETGDPGVWDLFDVGGSMMKKFKQVTERVSWDGSTVYFDGDPIHSVLAEQLNRTLQQGEADDYVALARFWEKLASNPNDHSREQGYDWLACHKFQITADGDVVGYKGVTDNHNGTYSSTAASQVRGKPSAYVNGQPEPELSRVTQRIGDVVTMPRDEVVHDPGQACRRGLHVATHNYAQSYGKVLTVYVNPRDICSVPTADHGEKVRVNRYYVADIAADRPGESPVLRSGEPVTYWEPDVGYRG